jgi:hypothetical protein
MMSKPNFVKVSMSATRWWTDQFAFIASQNATQTIDEIREDESKVVRALKNNASMLQDWVKEVLTAYSSLIQWARTAPVESNVVLLADFHFPPLIKKEELEGALMQLSVALIRELVKATDVTWAVEAPKPVIFCYAHQIIENSVAISFLETKEQTTVTHRLYGVDGRNPKFQCEFVESPCVKQSCIWIATSNRK